MIAPARPLAMYVCQRVDDKRLKEIADAFGLASCAGAGSTIRQIKRRIKKDSALARQIERKLLDPVSSLTVSLKETPTAILRARPAFPGNELQTDLHHQLKNGSFRNASIVTALVRSIKKAPTSGTMSSAFNDGPCFLDTSKYCRNGDADCVFH